MTLGTPSLTLFPLKISYSVVKRKITVHEQGFFETMDGIEYTVTDILRFYTPSVLDVIKGSEINCKVDKVI